MSLPTFDPSKAFHLTASPQPSWQPGENQPSLPEHGKSISIDPAQLAKPDCYKFLISAVVPRPIALVSTIDSATGVVNVAPYSYFNVVCHDPPTLMISVNAGRTGQKDTLRNLLSTPNLVINSFSEWTAESANHTTTPYPAHESELGPSGLTPIPSELVAPPRIAEAAVSFECRVSNVNMLCNAEGKQTAAVVLCTVIKVHVKEGVFDQDKGVVEMDKYKPLGRLGGVMYGRVTEGFELHRPMTAAQATVAPSSVSK
ncbi:hypothetical protein HDU86_007613 [Geranomyces michiganensis]|nr:hypothetical protein HDU86_007613 [Geranomyces michiganensis]